MITDVYPYGNGEKTFIKPEIEILARSFDITLISCGKGSINADESFLLKNRVKVIKYEMRNSYCNPKYAFRTIMSEPFIKELVVIIRERKKIFTRLKTSFWFVKEAIEFAEWLKQHQLIGGCKVFYTYWYYAHTLSLIMLKRQDEALKVLTRAHGYDIHDIEIKGGRECCKKYMDKSLNAIVFISDEGRDYYLTYNNIEKSKRHVIFRLGAPETLLDQNEIEVDNRQENTLNIISCSHLNSWKRVNLIIDACSRVMDYSINWSHYGEGSMGDSLSDYAFFKLGNKKNINYTFKGYVERENIYSDYADNHYNAYVLLSEMEGLPVSNMEAIANGMPIIITDVGGSAETFDNNGVLLSKNPSINEIKNAFDCIFYSSKERYIDMRRNSYRLWKEKFNVDNNMKSFVEFLNQYK